MRVANEIPAPELDLVISQFVDDFQDIIRRQVEHAVKKALGRGPRKAARPRQSAKKSPRATRRAAAVASNERAVKAAAPEANARGRAGSKRKGQKRAPLPGQLSLF